MEDYSHKIATLTTSFITRVTVMKKLFDSPGLAGVDEAKGRPADFKPGDDDYYAVVDHDDDDRKTMIQEIVFPPLAEANAAGSEGFPLPSPSSSN